MQRESLRLGLLTLCEQLSPPERAAFVLREAHALPHKDVAAILDISEVAARQHLSRARRRLQVDGDRITTSANERAMAGLAAALATGDLATVADLLAHDVQIWTDGGGVVSAARRPIIGPDKCARFLLGTSVTGTTRIATMNAHLGTQSLSHQGVLRVGWVDTRAGPVSLVGIQSNPKKLARVRSMF